MVCFGKYVDEILLDSIEEAAIEFSLITKFPKFMKKLVLFELDQILPSCTKILDSNLIISDQSKSYLVVNSL